MIEVIDHNRDRVADGSQLVAWVDHKPEPAEPRAYQPSPLTGGIHLSSQEERVLRMLERSSSPLSAEAIDQRLTSHWRQGDGGIVKVLICHLRAKLGRDVIGTERGSGYYLTAIGRHRLAALREAA